jgi:WD40 repeat protein
MPERRCVRTLELARGSGLADVTPDLSRVLARAGPGPVMVDARGGRELANITGVPGNYSHFNADCTRFSPDGSRISVVGSDGSLGVWNAATLQREWSVRAYAGPDVWPGRLLGGCWSPDGRWIATLPADLRAQVWNAENGELVREWHVRGSGSQQALFSRDSRCLFVSGGTVNGLECWDVESGACLWSFPKDFATSLHLDSEGRRLFCLRSGATAVRDAGTGVLITSLELDPTLAYGFSVSPVDDTLVTATPQGLRFWDTSRPR